MRIRLFRGYAHECSYLPEAFAQSLYVEEGTALNPVIYTRLAEQGFRRSGNLVYKPECPDCNACVPVRIPVRRFQLNRAQQRTWKDNQDLSVAVCPAVFDEEQYALFSEYVGTRHQDGGMSDSSPAEYMGFLSSAWSETWFVEFREDKKLLAIAVVDRLDGGLSAVYTFFDPKERERSLGTFAVLWQIEEARRLGLDWVYLGFWIEQCQKMSYKEKYRPIEALLDDEWRVFEKGGKIQR